ncbi:hypothetical protein ROZALSC1DRAFT_28519 [Rozella allomycis CSF55]|uniref:RING-type E3 ubiquitin transferase n=1 Tax=Rozella allomycis (strain CSF55) TaxID=988480 RepID=A0A075AQ87_ROZAC|nr:hypothetical protein O9G_001313 [Rozella allomycis CSF55]RKP19938.1 hypothetical protein ROZALSC1DRAFT_28519 [Rozella allomycis CSF55]|eukprot:EPZ32411.1 hypothetical protein O9G_001313 [Rozella allomycis CSF55]
MSSETNLAGTAFPYHYPIYYSVFTIPLVSIPHSESSQQNAQPENVPLTQTHNERDSGNEHTLESNQTNSGSHQPPMNVFIQFLTPILYPSPEFLQGDYETLLQLQEILGGNVKKAASKKGIDAETTLEIFDSEKHCSHDCSICLNEYSENDNLRSMNACGHAFHKDCLDNWLTQYNNSCPLCRTEITSSVFQ